MFVNIFIVEKMENSIMLLEESLPIKAQLTGDKWVICLDVAVDPFKWCREKNYIMRVKPYYTRIPDYKYSEEWTIEIIPIGESAWTYTFREVDAIL